MERPLADYFWISGINDEELANAYIRQPQRISTVDNPGLDATPTTIPEDGHLPQGHLSMPTSPRMPSAHSRQSSYQRLSRLSSEARNSILSLETSSPTAQNPPSSLFPPKQAKASRMSTAMSEADFDMAIKKFTSDRDSFFVGLSFDSPATESPSPPARTKTHQIIAEESEDFPNRGFGSIRRVMSIRQSSGHQRVASLNRHVSTKNSSRRVSTYASVVPSPEKLPKALNINPLKRRFEPALLDRYPRPEMANKIRQRNSFPSHVPMFAFPNDISIVSSDTRPPSTWHEFSMTAADNTKVAAVCVVLWLPVGQDTASDIAKRCEEWKKANMTEAEIEMAASLSERLALEEAKLSRLLSQLAYTKYGSVERDELEEEIGQVEEKIALMTDMLKPLANGTTTKIEGLSDGETGLWFPRAYGVLGRDSCHAGFWKDWLRAIVIPMMDGRVLRVPASSPKVGMWQPLETYVYNLCCKALSPEGSRTQTNINVRELQLYAKKEAINELPGSRTVDLYPLFRALASSNVLLLFEYMLAESRIILLSSHTAMLQAAAKAMVSLLWPLQWAGIYIPVLPARLVQVLDAPCPYICGVERGYGKIALPDDDFVLVDLDKNELQSTAHPPALPRHQRKKLLALLHLAAPHHHSCGVPISPPTYIIETFPHDAFASENEQAFSPAISQHNLLALATIPSTSFGAPASFDTIRRKPVLNAFLQSNTIRLKSGERPTTSSTTRHPGQPNHEQTSPFSGSIPQVPTTPVSKNDSGFALQAAIQDKRGAPYDTLRSRRSESISTNVKRRPSIPFIRHVSSPSGSTLNMDAQRSGSTYAISTYASSTLAASTMMPGMTFQAAQNTDTVSWAEGHHLQLRAQEGESRCGICDERTEDDHYVCAGCGIVVHGRCSGQITIVCPAAFFPDQIRTAFARCFATLLVSYRKFMRPASQEQRKLGMFNAFDYEGFGRSLPPEGASYLEVLRQTQSFNEFIAQREHCDAASACSIELFDAFIAAKRNRKGRRLGSLAIKGRSFFDRSSGPSSTIMLSDSSTHLWRIVSYPSSTQRPNLTTAGKGRDYSDIVTRIPAKFEDELFYAGDEVPTLPAPTGRARGSPRKQRMNGLNMNAP